MRIIGISAFYHDSAAALVQDGRIIAAAQEERFTRKKHDQSFPVNALRYCLEEGGLKPEEVDHVAFYDKPFLKFERLLETYLTFAPRGYTSFRMALPLWLGEKLFQKRLLNKELKALAPDVEWEKRLLFSEHHLSHAASAFYPSPFEEALVLTMDGVGEWTTTSAALGQGKDLKIMREIHFPHSIGLLYSAFTYYTGFKVNSGEYKLMGLAPYGEPKYAQLILDKIMDLKPDGSFRLDQNYFDYCTGLTMTNSRFDELFGGPRAASGAEGDAARDGSRRLDPGGDRGGDAAADPLARQGDRGPQSVPGRRRRPQLRGQRQDPARQQLRADLDPARGGRCRRRAGRGACRPSSATGPAAPAAWQQSGCDAGLLSRPRL